MARFIRCDVCSGICQPAEYFKLSAWWGKHLRLELSGGDRAWEPKRIDELPPIQLEICQCCFDTHLHLSLQLHKPRENYFKERRQNHPDEVWIKSLRLTALAGCVEQVHCDRCGVSCFDKHLQIESDWCDEQGQTLRAELCEACVQREVLPLTQSMRAQVL